MQEQQLQRIYDTNIKLLNRLSIRYQEWRHEPIVDFATDEKVAKRLGWTATHSKSLFLKLKGGGFALYLTDKDSRLDSKAVKAILGKRVSICSDDEMISAIGCVPGAVCPIGLPKEVTIIVDSKLLSHQELLYTPGYPELTLSLAAEKLPALLAATENPIHYLAK